MSPNHVNSQSNLTRNSPTQKCLSESVLLVLLNERVIVTAAAVGGPPRGPPTTTTTTTCHLKKKINLRSTDSKYPIREPRRMFCGGRMNLKPLVGVPRGIFFSLGKWFTPCMMKGKRMQIPIREKERERQRGSRQDQFLTWKLGGLFVFISDKSTSSWKSVGIGLISCENHFNDFFLRRV